jgi:hypothetical protein
LFENLDITPLATICPAIEGLKLCPQARWLSIALVSCLSHIILSHPLIARARKGIVPPTSGCKRLYTLDLALNAKASSDKILNTCNVSFMSLYRLHVGHSHMMKDSLQVAILLSHLAPHIDNLKWLNERGPRSNALNVSADGWHKVCEYLPHLQAIRLAEKRMSAAEYAVPSAQ